MTVMRCALTGLFCLALSAGAFAGEGLPPAQWTLAAPGPLADSRMQQARSLYLELLDRQLKSDWEKYYSRTLNNKERGKAISRFDLFYFSALAYRASLLDPSQPDQAKTRDALFSQAKMALNAYVSAIGEDNPLMAQEMLSGLNSVCRISTILRDNGVLSDGEQQTVLDAVRKGATAGLEMRMERGAFNRPSSMALGLATVLNLVPDSQDAPLWKSHVDAVWRDFAGPGDTFEDASGYNGLFSYGIVGTAGLTGRVDELRDPRFEKIWDRMSAWTAPNGILPDFGNTTFMHAATFWICAWERLAGIYRRSDFQDNAQRLARALLSQKSYRNYELEPLSEAIECLVPAQPSRPPRAAAEVTYRQSDWGDTILDKLILRTSPPDAPAAFVCVDLHDGGYHGHQDGGALSLYALGDSVLLHGLGRPAIAAMLQQSAWGTRPDLPFFHPESEVPDNEWVDALINIRWPGTYVGAFTPDLKQVKRAFFRLQDIPNEDKAIDLEVGGVWAIDKDGSEVRVSGPWHGSFDISSGKDKEVRFCGSPALDVSDLTPYENLRVRWKISDARALTPYGYFGLDTVALNGDSPSDTATLRAMAAQPVRQAWVGDGASGGFLRDMADALGRIIRHRREMRLSPDGSLSVVDRFSPTVEGDYSIGPVWHVQNILESGQDWIVGRDDFQKESFALPPRAVKFAFSSPDAFQIERTEWKVANGQNQHFAAVITKHLRAGEEVAITTQLTPQQSPSNP